MSTNLTQLDIVYNDKRANTKTLQQEQVQIQPRVFFKGQEDKNYTLIMWDPDAPAKSWLHWLITNISGAVPDISQADEVLSYSPPSPPSGTHRYFFTIYEQPTSIFAVAPAQRGHFDVEQFAKAYGLKRVSEQMIKVPAK